MAAHTGGSGELRGLALRTLLPGFVGTDAPPRWVARLAAEGLGGVVLFGRNVDPSRRDEGVAALTASLRAVRSDLLVAIDEEGGDVTRLDVASGSKYPGAAALGVVDAPELTSEVAASLARRLRECGVGLNLAPVADIDLDPRNPVVGVRSFGGDAGLVARHVAAFVEGQQANGVAATVKHFPGHGGTAEDTHLTVPVVEASRELLHRRELVPFRAALAAGVKAVMTCHVRVPALDAANPATLSPAVIDGLLRRELGYDGTVLSDGLDMHAISRTVGRAEGAVQALVAGVDGLCVGGESTSVEQVEEIVAAIVGAVRSGRLPYERLAEAAGRVAGLAGWVDAGDGLGAVRRAEEGKGEPAEVRAARQALEARGVVTLRSAPLVLELQDEPTLAAGAVPWGMGEPLAARFPGTVVVAVHEHGIRPERAVAEHPGRPVVVSARGTRRVHWQRAAVLAVRRARPDAIVVDHGLPAVGGFGEPYLLTYGASRVSAEAAADLLADHAASARHADLLDWSVTDGD